MTNERAETHGDMINRQAVIDAHERIFDRCEEIEAHLPEDDPDRIGYKMYPDWLTVWKYLNRVQSEEPEQRTVTEDDYAYCTECDHVEMCRWYPMYGCEFRSRPSVQPEQRWIPCSERLPEENGQYLITVKYEHEAGYDDIYAEHGDWSDGKWDMFSFGHCGKVESIVAWMPLPDPYREEGEQE